MFAGTDKHLKNRRGLSKNTTHNLTLIHANGQEPKVTNHLGYLSPSGMRLTLAQPTHRSRMHSFLFYLGEVNQQRIFVILQYVFVRNTGT